MKKSHADRYRIFISSVQKEFTEERRCLKKYIFNDSLLKLFVSDIFLFEDLPARDQQAEEAYLGKVDACDLYIGLFGNDYGYEDSEGLSPTEREFDRATANGKTRIIFVKGDEDRHRHPKMARLIQKAASQLIRRRFNSLTDLTAAFYAAMVEHLKQSGDLRTLPFDASSCPGATLSDLLQENIKAFLATAKRERNYPLPVNTAREKALIHLNLLEGGLPTHAAVLLFGKNPQRFLPTSEIKCMHFHGVTVRKPIPSYQIYKGTTFELVDQAVDFILSKINRHIGTREYSAKAPATYELPKGAVIEAIVNAVAHRDYTSNASVQVMLFADRLEVWNPGELPPSLTPERLREPHASIPRNPLIAEPLYLARYIEKAGSGTLDMIERCGEAGLPSPVFEERGGLFVTILWRDWLTDEVLSSLGLNERQLLGLKEIKVEKQLTTMHYQDVSGCSRRTAIRDLNEMIEKGIIQRQSRGRSSYYVLSRNHAIITPTVPSDL